jgi:hypothetical protein
MKLLVEFILILSLLSCSGQPVEWKQEWDQHEDDFREVAALLRAGKLKVVYGRMGYAIPDTFELQTTCGQIVFRETDFAYDSSYSILFRLNLDTNAISRTEHMIVYTDNLKRLTEYESESGNVHKIDTNWFFVNR